MSCQESVEVDPVAGFNNLTDAGGQQRSVLSTFREEKHNNMLSKHTLRTTKLYVWLGHYVLLVFPFTWNRTQGKFTPEGPQWNAALVHLVLGAHLSVKVFSAIWLLGFSWFCRNSIEIWELTMNLFLFSGMIITGPLYYLCLRAGAATGSLLNSILMLNKKIAAFHGLPDLTNADGLERPMNSIRIAVILLLCTCPFANMMILEYYKPQSLVFIMSLSPVPITSTFLFNLVTSAAVSYAFAADAFIASGFVQFSMIVINVTNEWLRCHMLRGTGGKNRSERRRTLLRAIHVMHRITTEEYAYAMNPVYILTSVIFLVILLFLIIRFFTSLNLAVVLVLGVTVLVTLYCMEISFKMGTRTIQASPNPSQYYGARPRLTGEELRFLRSCPPLEWRIGVFYSVKNQTFALIMSEFAVPSVINLLLSGH